MSSCPVKVFKAEIQEEIKLNSYVDNRWYKKILFKWSYLFLGLMMIIACLLWMSLKFYSNTFPVGLFFTLVFGLSPFVFILILYGYSWQIRESFSVEGKKLPVLGLLRVLYDVMGRTKTLLRVIDLERMKKLGEIYLFFAGFRPAIVVTSSVLAEEISKDYLLYSKSDPRDLNMPFFFDWVGNNNIVLANGKKWEELRELIHSAVNEVQVFSPIFHQKAQILTHIIEEEIRKTQRASQEEVGIIGLTRWLKAISLDNSGVALFGFDFKHLYEERNPGIDAMDYIINEIFNPLRIAFPLINRLPLASNRKLKECTEHLDQLVLDMIEATYAGPQSKEASNVLELLIRGKQERILNTHELRNNILALVLASHETTQVSLSAALYYLAKYPEHQERLRRESQELFQNLNEDFQSLGSLDKEKGSAYRKLQTFHSMTHFILESLRLYSPLANQNPRTTTKDTFLGGYKIPQGTLVIINIHAIHMSEKEWNQPETFDPSRYAKGVCPKKFSHLPFGAGPRLCSGRNFSLMEQKIILCHLLRNFRIELPKENYEVPLLRGSFTGLPSDDFKLRFLPLSS